MRNLLKILLVLPLSLLLFLKPAYAASTPDAAPLASNPQKSIMVAQKEPQFTIILPSNPTTGYSWFIEAYDANLLTLVKHRYNPPTNAMPGAGGFEAWIFAVKPEAFAAPQVTKINLIYARPWNISTTTSKKTTFTVVIH